MNERPNNSTPIGDDPTLDAMAEIDSSDELVVESQDEYEFETNNTDSLPSGVPNRLGEYTLLELIGEGGMGQVFVAEHGRMKRRVAIKLLPTGRMSDPKAVDRFYEEIHAASRLLHPNIVTAFDAGEASGVHYLAMEYIDGQTLTNIISQEGPMSVGQAAAVIRQAAMGLLHAHRAGVVHRDVKPGNLMRARDGTIKVLDLGLAQVNSEQWSAAKLVPESDSAKKKQGRLVGTLSYMSPEQLEDPDSADARSDIYSLGAVFYFLLIGRPPYTGELLDLVYGHRHGELPELMQLRNDVDLKFENIFRRMMAKSPSARFGSLDEVIDELAEYADKKSTPLWISDFSTGKHGELSTASGGSTSRGLPRVIGIDLGMFYVAAAEANATTGIQTLKIDGESNVCARLSVSGDGRKLFFGEAANARREPFPHSVIHCLLMYIGKQTVSRPLNGTKYPPETLIGMTVADLLRRAWTAPLPDAAAIVVPSSYDQLHRRSVLLSCQMAGLNSIRMVDRTLAAAQSLLIQSEGPDAATSKFQVGELLLVVSLTGQATDVAVIRHRSERMEQIANSGHWHTGTLGWLQALVKYIAERVAEVTGLDPRKVPKSIAPLQISCERAMDQLMVDDRVRVSIPLGHKRVDIVVRRETWIQRCQPLVDEFLTTIDDACNRAGVKLDRISTCLTLGPILRVPELRDRVLEKFRPNVTQVHLEASDVARGAAACVTAELPGRVGGTLPPRGVTTQSIGIVVEDAKGRRRILPIIPRGSVLPARTNRRLTVAAGRSTMTLAVVESAGVDSKNWHSLGRYKFDVAPSGHTQTRLLSFEVDVNGLLNVRMQSPNVAGSVKLEPLPKPMLDDESVTTWKQSIGTLIGPPPLPTKS